MRRTAVGAGLLAFAALALGVGQAAEESGGAPLDLAGKRVLFLGDSITHNGTYVRFVEYELIRRFPGHRVDFISAGLSSETVSGLSEKDHPFPRPCVHERLARALNLVKPSVVVACYGMNDGIYHPPSPDRLKAYQDGIRRLIEAVKAAGAVTVLLTPPPFDPEPVRDKLLAEGAPDDGYSFRRPFARYDAVVREYSRWLLTLRSPTQRVIDLNEPMTDYVSRRRQGTPDFRFSGDGIHPDATGHMLMARLFLRGIGVEKDIGDPEARAAAVKADPLHALVRRRGDFRSRGWLEYIGYTRERPVKADSIEHVEFRAEEMMRQIERTRDAATGTQQKKTETPADR